jgi:hydroxyacylglutathione hydrolase
LKERIAEAERLRAANEPTLPTTIGREKATNPFLRADEPALMRKIGGKDAKPAQVFAEIRTRKDRF